MSLLFDLADLKVDKSVLFEEIDHTKVEPSKVIFQPIPNSSQAFALNTRAHYTLYHGARGPGKTITQIMRFRLRVGMGYGAFWRGVIFDREYKNLSDIVAQGKRFLLAFGDGCRFLSSASEFKFVWPTGEELLLRHAKTLEDYENFHGHEYPFIGFNELTKHPTPDLHDKLLSTNRSSFDPERDTPKATDKTGKFVIGEDGEVKYLTANGKPLPPIPLEVFSTTNPSGPGHNWVKRRFINVAPDGVMVRRTQLIFNPKTRQEEPFTLTQVAIFGSYKENPYLDPKYVAELNSISDPNLKAAWLQGSWDVMAGGALDDLWNRECHIIPRFTVPENWPIDRAFDWGSTAPFSVGWFTVANGEEVTLPNGAKWTPVAGSIIQIAEWYGSEEIGSNKGLKMSSGDIAKGINKIEEALVAYKFIHKLPSPGPADNQITQMLQEGVDTLAKSMSDEGVEWIASDKSKGSRVVGLQLMRDRLDNSLKCEKSGFYVMNNCIATIEILPTLARDDKNPQDVDSEQEDHIWDMIRYRILKDGSRAAHKDLKMGYYLR